MRNRGLVFFLICLAIIAIAELSVLLTTVTPAEATPVQLWIFFACLLVICSLALTPIWYFIKKKLMYRQSRLSYLACLRQSTLFTLALILALFFNTLHILTVWDLVPLCISMLLIEFFFEAEKASPNVPHVTHN